jgi:hypothetical protein
MENTGDMVEKVYLLLIILFINFDNIFKKIRIGLHSAMKIAAEAISRLLE